MDWLDGMTGCGGECNIDGASVTMTNFELWEQIIENVLIKILKRLLNERM